MQPLRILLYGFLTWLVPFVVSFGFYTPGGELRTSQDFFKSMMIIVSTGTGCYLLYHYFKGCRQSYQAAGILSGICWLIINLLLDITILIPFANMSYRFYFESIGLRYMNIPIISVAMGFALQRISSVKGFV